eukprot:CAMPEP_0167821752 /NCGR_PEP_ID=MMETSP0112_2-20121227/7012_1 /TAXON_ID=91324 /ORGANISM="Lotharella globosa, Strain CCCM811" /LENGTH=50 /DNA_ID=CAMNT_0007722837 /DNA_START=68 /DNA_END=216 /DNA_ORIENTATION=-
MPKVRKKKKMRHDPLLKQMTDDPGYLKAPKKPAVQSDEKEYADDDAKSST